MKKKMKTNKKAIGCFLAVFMLLAVSLASAGTYTVRPALDNADVEKEVITIEEELSSTSGSDVRVFGNVWKREGWTNNPFPSVIITAFRPGPFPRNPWLMGRIVAQNISYLKYYSPTMDRAYYEMHVPPGRYILYASKEGYKTIEPGSWYLYFGQVLWWYWYSCTWEAGESYRYYFILELGDNSDPPVPVVYNVNAEQEQNTQPTNIVTTFIGSLLANNR